jgi:hypothetical protein
MEYTSAETPVWCLASDIYSLHMDSVTSLSYGLIVCGVERYDRTVHLSVPALGSSSNDCSRTLF